MNEDTQTMTLDRLQAEAPELLAEIRADAAAQGFEQGKNEGILDERVRVTEILNADAAADQTRKAIEDGIEADAAYKLFYEAEKEKRAQGLQEMQAEATDPMITADPEPTDAPEKTPAQKRAAWRPQSGPTA